MAAHDTTALQPLSLTHVLHDPSDPLSHASAWAALVPQALCIMYVTLIWASREVEICMMFAGQLACEGLNWVLKRTWREGRPRGECLTVSFVDVYFFGNVILRYERARDVGGFGAEEEDVYARGP